MNITRKEFCDFASAGTVLLLLEACGGGGTSGYSSGAPAMLVCGAGDSGISGNHGHVLSMLSADLDSMVAKSYSIAGSATHDHTVSFSVAQLQQLKAGNPVTVTSSVGDGHTHSVTASMASGCP